MEEKDTFLANPRVLDLSDKKGLLCGQILALLGADVISIEKPEGNPTRGIGPFYQDISGPERSLYWLAFNTNKRGITLNIETQEGRDILIKLVRGADVVIESFSPGYMDKLSLGYSKLSEVNPRLVMTSITPFGQNGPYKDFKASDIVALGMGGLMFLSGDPDRAPLRFSIEHWQMGALCGALGTLVAIYQRNILGVGQFVDVSIQEAVLSDNLYNIPNWDIGKVRYRRGGPLVTRGNNTRRGIWKCKDGYICWTIWVAELARRQKAMVDWMEEEGMAGELRDVDWGAMNMNQVTQKQIDRWEKIFAPFFLSHTKEECHKEAIKRGMILCPLATMDELLENSQLASYNYWSKVDHPELGASLTYPGFLFQSHPAHCSPTRRAPVIGEHNEEIYVRELGIPQKEFLQLKQRKII